MSAIKYDLDTSGGLMDQIQALIAPPRNEDGNEKNKKPEHPYYKRPGKGHNHDTCDACGEGGDLICCDKCPYSFHFGCHDPPLEEKDIPRGEWLCQSCRYAKKKEVTTPLVLRSKRSNSTPPSTSLIKEPKKPKLSPMDVLIEVASAMNPKQFELPRSMSVPCVFPGIDKEIPYSKIGRKAKASAHEKGTGGIVPLPAKKCRECRKSCRVAPLIACDFCESFYHLDCLDPPLTNPPSGMWMCPLHVEHCLDSNLLTSVSATERVKLWDKFGGPVDQDAVKLQFFRKVHRKNPPFRIKTALPPRNTVIVPDMVKYHYKKPVNLLPSLRDVLRLEYVENRKKNLGKIDETVFKMEETEINEDSVKVELNHDINLDESNCDIKNKNSEETNFDGVTDNITDWTAVNGYVKNENLNGGFFEKELIKKEQNFISDMISGLTTEIELELKQLDDRLIRLLAYQRIQQLLSAPSSANNLFSPAAREKLRHMPLPSELLTPADIDRISRVFNSPKKKTKSNPVIRARAMMCPVVSKHFYNVRTTEVDPTEVRHDASFMGFRPTVSLRFPEAVAMRYRVLNIGKGSSNDVNLEKFGFCNNIISKHAVIFYDEYTKHYELINYSPYGTYVNNVLYSNIIFTKRPDYNISTEEKSANIEVQVREIIDKKRKVIKPRKPSLETKMSAVDCVERLECCCINNSEELKKGWEGSAILKHGSLLRFGCVSFVFSIVESTN
ncbi:unnamed protein product [Phyllotreta striolata]|uniref:Zinc finger PHD-type domain-containing protein n=1 Tax=Phyllotreta striolata TaxID=444603 RepID=A0A9N9XPT8_PHYSR|nr:unnamed protein product [Phyllotreta striolata]